MNVIRCLLVITVLLGEVLTSNGELSQSSWSGEKEEEDARKFMEVINTEDSRWQNGVVIAEWNYVTNLTDYNLQRKLQVSKLYDKWHKSMWEKLVRYQWKNFTDALLQRQFKLYSVLGTAALKEEKRRKLSETVAAMERIYSTTKVVEWSDRLNVLKGSKSEKLIGLEQLVDIFCSSEYTADQLKYYWRQWYSLIGQSVKHLFQNYVKLSNEVAKANVFPSVAEMWLDNYEMDDFEERIHGLVIQIQPFYKQLYTYVRRRLAKIYNTSHQTIIYENGPLPAHLLGDVWAQVWTGIYNRSLPYPDRPSVDVSPTMKEQKYTPIEIFKLSEQFYTSLNLSSMTDTFWRKSIFKRPLDREIVCHASAWDFYDGEDFRIKMCTKIDMTDLKIVHHEMGHIQYFQQYKDQPQVFKSGANHGFHEAIGDTLTLSVSTPKHLMKIGLLDPETYHSDYETDINSLYHMALDKIPFLPFAYVLDIWRWDVFRGKVTSENYNSHFWKLRYEYQGIIPPVVRREEGVDAAAKYHVAADVPYIRYFVSTIIQFQFHKALCIKAGQYDRDNPDSNPLHHCDIYQSVDAGNAFAKMLQMGSSQPWQYAMEVLTGQRDMDAGPLLEYFKPLLDWLVNENSKHGEIVGWE